MSNIFLDSKAKGTWEYEILKGKAKVKYPIKPGFNEIPESHLDTLKSDPGYNAKIAKGTYKILNKKKALVSDKESDKKIDQAKELNKVKEVCKSEIADLKKEHERQAKDIRTANTEKNQQLIDSRGEALRQVKDLEKDKTELVGKLSQLEDQSKKGLENSGIKFDEMKLEFEKKILDLKESHSKEVEGLKTSYGKEIEKLKKAK